MNLISLMTKPEIILKADAIASAFILSKSISVYHTFLIAGKCPQTLYFLLKKEGI